MTDSTSLGKKLQQLGLSKNQAEIYLLLIKHYELRIQKISERSQIPRSSVYESLKNLYELGLVEEIVEDNFRKIRANPLSAMKHSIEEQLASLQQVSRGIDELDHTIKLALPKTAQPSTVLRYYRGRSGARQLYWNTLKATNMVYVYSDWERRRYLGLKFYERFVAESRTRNIHERVLMNPTSRALGSIQQYNIPLSSMARTHIKDIRFLPEKNLLVTGDTLIYDNVYAQVYLNNNEINGFEIESTSFTESQRSIFKTLWRTSTPLADIL